MKLVERRRIAHLIFLSLFDLTNREQQFELNEWIEKRKENQELLKRLENSTYQSQRYSAYSEFDALEGWKKVEPRLRKRSKRLFYRFIPYAAVLLATIGIVTFLYTGSFVHREIDNRHGVTTLPSGVRLVLEDGRTLELNTSRSVGNDSVAGILENDGQRLVYKHSKYAVIPQRHLLQIPRGAEYMLVLSDGTKVWLNAETELSYPSFFSGESRKVHLKGEAYFEVTSDASMPFIVETDRMQVNVLGTSFNVSAYPGEVQHTTLVEGKVRALSDGTSVELMPGEQALLTDSGITVQTVDVNNYVGWKEKRFVFKNRPIEEVVRELERWYDVHFVISREVQGIRLTANLPKYEDVDKILDIIEDIAQVKYEINGGEIIIKSEQRKTGKY